MKKMKSLMLMMAAAVALVMGVSSCGSDDDEPEVAVAAQVAGSYTGQEVMTVMGDVDESTKTFVFAKATDTSLDMTIPEYGEGMMSLPALTVKGVALTKNGNTITGKVASYSGAVQNADGTEKAYTVSDVTVIFSDQAVVVTFTLKYGNMPFTFAGQFTGMRK
jgi:lipopolysaccharide export system protein LptA